MDNYHFAHTPIEQVSDPDLQGLFDEIAKLQNIPKVGWVLHFLQQAFHPLTQAHTTATFAHLNGKR